MIMEGFAGFGERFEYALVGHSGDSAAIPLVTYGRPPKDERERFKVLDTLAAHAQCCSSGDSTLEAIRAGTEAVLERPADEHFLFVVSDANLRRYGITPGQLSQVLKTDQRVRSYVIFIGSVSDEAEIIKYVSVRWFV